MCGRQHMGPGFGAKGAGGVLLLLLACLSGGWAQQNQWVLDNGDVRRTIAFDPQKGLLTTSWQNEATGTEFLDLARERSAPCREFRFRADDQMITGSPEDVRVEGAPQVASGATVRLDVDLLALKAPLRIIVHYEAPKGFAGVRQWLTIQNLGPKPILLSDMVFECVQMEPAPARDMIAFGNYGQEPRETFFTGRINDVAILLESAKSGEGMAILNEAPAYLRRTETGILWQPCVQAMYDVDLFPFERHLAPQERFDTAANSVVMYRRGTSDDPHWVIPEYVEQVIAHNHNSEPPNWIYNDWKPWMGQATAAILSHVVDRAAAMDLNLDTIDEGWEEKLGNNTPDPHRFPQGLMPVFDNPAGHPQKRGLWFPVALVNKQSSIFLDHPEWVCKGADGKPKHSQGQGVVMYMGGPYRDSVLERVSEAVRKYNLSYIKLDLTTVFNAYGEQPGCFDGGPGESVAESNVRIYEGLDWLAQQLHARFPHLLLDYTFELWGEKHLVDYGLLRDADLDWVMNVADTTPESSGPLQLRTLVYQRAMAIPTEDLLTGNLLANMPTWQERAATEMATAPVLLGDLRELSSDQIAGYASWIGKFNKLRQDVPISESFFPLGNWMQPKVTAWDGYGRFARSGEGLLVLFRNESTAPSATITIPGFPDGHFRVTDWNSTARISVDGAQLRRGFDVPLAGMPAVRVLEIRKARD